MINLKNLSYIRRQDLLDLSAEGFPSFVLDEETLNEIFFDLLSIDGLESLFYPAWADFHPKLINKAYEMGLGFSCTQPGEAKHLYKKYPGFDARRLLYLPGNISETHPEQVFGYGGSVIIKEQDLPKLDPAMYLGGDIIIGPEQGNEEKVDSSFEKSIKGICLGSESNLSIMSAPEKIISHYHKALKRFPTASILVLENRGGKEESRDEKMKGEHLLGIIEKIYEAFPSLRLWLELPLSLLYHACGLLVRVLAVDEASGVRYISVNLDQDSSEAIVFSARLPMPVNLSRNETGKRDMNTQITGQDKTPIKRLQPAQFPADIRKGDILFFGGVFPGNNARTNEAKKRICLISTKWLSARRICQVKV